MTINLTEEDMTISFQRRRLLQGGAAAALLPLTATVHAAASNRFAIGDHDFLLDGKPIQIRCGEIDRKSVV